MLAVPQMENENVRTSRSREKLLFRVIIIIVGTSLPVVASVAYEWVQRFMMLLLRYDRLELILLPLRTLNEKR